MINPLPIESLPSRQHRRRARRYAWLAIALWSIALLGAAGIIACATSAPAGAAVMEPITVIIHPPATFMISAVGMSGAALILSVFAVMIATQSRRPRGGI